MRAPSVTYLRHQILRIIAIAILATLCTFAPASVAFSDVRSDRSTDVEMTRDEAGDYYMLGACKNGEAQNQFSQAVWGNRDRIGVAEVRRRLPELKRLSARAARSIHTWARHLYNPPAAWPADVADKARSLAAKNVRYAQFRRTQSYATNAAQWLNNNGKANKVKFGTLASTIRARLDLPPAGRGC